jgi:hypothetical protein
LRRKKKTLSCDKSHAMNHVYNVAARSPQLPKPEASQKVLEAGCSVSPHTPVSTPLSTVPQHPRRDPSDQDQYYPPRPNDHHHSTVSM